ncbi:MAG: S8 family serine peptidase [Candidatus Cryptobacteroides sp.]
MKRIVYIILAIAAFSAVSCAEKESLNLPEKPVVLPETDAVEGELLVKFDARVADILDEVLPATKAGGPATRSGIVTVDDVLELVGTYQFERVFPKNAKTENQTRQSEMHLWYIVRFDREHSLAEVSGRLRGLADVVQVQPNRKIKKNFSTKSVPVGTDEMLVEKQAGVEFNDPYVKYQWHLVNDGKMFAASGKSVAGADVGVLEAWQKCTGDPSIVVAVVDEGVDFSNPDLAPNAWINEDEGEYGSDEDLDGNGYAGDRHGYNFVKNTGFITTNDIYDSGHGSHVAGVIAAQNNNGIGISSIAGGTPDKPGVKIMSCQIFSGNTETTVLSQLRAIKYAADNGAHVLQCSWGYISGAANPYLWGQGYDTDEMWNSYSPLEQLTIDYFVHNGGSHDGVLDGGIAIFAAGNETAPMACYPGKYKDYVSVAATAADWTPATYSNYGDGTTVCAPGGDQNYYYDYTDKVGDGESGGIRGERGCVLSVLPKNVAPSGYGYMEGTSMACPHVSGVVALGLSYAVRQRRHFTAQEFIELRYTQGVTPIEQIEKSWPRTKKWSDFATEIENVPTTLELKRDYTGGKMGYGQVNAARLLNAIDGAGTPMHFPNVLVSVDSEVVYNPAIYFKTAETNFSATVADDSVASVSVDRETHLVTVKGLKSGATKASITAGGENQEFVITVRKSAGENGWL